MRFDLVIKGGQTIDDAAGLTGRNDVAIVKDRIVAVEPGIPAESAFRAIDAGGRHGHRRPAARSRRGAAPLT